MPLKASGVDAMISALKSREAGAEEAVRASVMAGAKVVAERLQASAPVKTGELRKSIKPGRVEDDPAGGYACTVKPVGKDRHGESLAKIGNILEYGRSYGRTAKAGIGWFHPTVLLAEKDVKSAMADAFRKRMEGKG